MSTPSLTQNFKTWDVKVLWLVNYPSALFDPGEVTPAQFQIYGVDRSSLTITRPLTRINSLEQYNQGYQNGVPDIRVTIFTKESGEAFEKMRRLAATQIPFDVQLNLASDDTTTTLEDNAHEGIWIDGYESFLGCRVTTERTNYNIAEFPVREFECMALRHIIKEDDEDVFSALIEGDGNYATAWPTGSATPPA